METIDNTPPLAATSDEASNYELNTLGLQEHDNTGCPTPISFSLIQSDKNRLTKEMSLKDGKLKKNGTTLLYSGNVQTIQVNSIKEFSDRLEKLHPNEAVTFGVTQNGASKITSKKNLLDNPGTNAISRTKEHFGWNSSPSILILDHDPQSDTSGVCQQRCPVFF